MNVLVLQAGGGHATETSGAESGDLASPQRSSKRMREEMSPPSLKPLITKNQAVPGQQHSSLPELATEQVPVMLVSCLMFVCRPFKDFSLLGLELPWPQKLLIHSTAAQQLASIIMLEDLQLKLIG